MRADERRSRRGCAVPACAGNDPDAGVMRHADAGYGIAVKCA